MHIYAPLKLPTRVPKLCDYSHAVQMELFVSRGDVDFGFRRADELLLPLRIRLQDGEDAFDPDGHSDAWNLEHRGQRGSRGLKL